MNVVHYWACCHVTPHRVEAEAMGQKPTAGQLSSGEGKLSVHHSHGEELCATMTSTCVRPLECVVHARDSHDV